MSIQTFDSHPSSPRGIWPFERIMEEYNWDDSLPTTTGDIMQTLCIGGYPLESLVFDVFCSSQTDRLRGGIGIQYMQLAFNVLNINSLIVYSQVQLMSLKIISNFLYLLRYTYEYTIRLLMFRTLKANCIYYMPDTNMEAGVGYCNTLS